MDIIGLGLGLGTRGGILLFGEGGVKGKWAGFRAEFKHCSGIFLFVLFLYL